MLLCIHCSCRLSKLLRTVKGYILIVVLIIKCLLAMRRYFRLLQLQIVLSVSDVKVRAIHMFLNVASSLSSFVESECGRQITEGVISFKSRCDHHVISIVSVESLLNFL